MHHHVGFKSPEAEQREGHPRQICHQSPTQFLFGSTRAALTPPSELCSCLSAISHPKQAKDVKSFNFDYSYWSHTSVTSGTQPQHTHV